MYSLFDFKAEEILKISAKNGVNVEAVLDTILEKFAFSLMLII